MRDLDWIKKANQEAIDRHKLGLPIFDQKPVSPGITKAQLNRQVSDDFHSICFFLENEGLMYLLETKEAVTRDDLERIKAYLDDY